MVLNDSAQKELKLISSFKNTILIIEMSPLRRDKQLKGGGI